MPSPTTTISISRLLSSPTILPLHPSLLPNLFLTRKSLKHLSHLFPDYNFRDFRTTSLLHYQQLKKSQENGDLVNPMKYLSAGVYREWKGNGGGRGFRFYRDVLDFKIKGVRVFENEDGVWPQITVEMTHGLQKGGYQKQKYVLERKYQMLRLVDHWRYRMFPVREETEEKNV